MRAFIIGTALLISATASAAGQNEVLARCSLGKGYGYYMQSPIVPADDANKWIDDGFSSASAQVILIRNGDAVDLITTDAIGTRTASSDGATLIPFVNVEANIIQVTVMYPAKPTVESYIFVLKSGGGGSVIWTTARTGAGVLGPKVGAYVGECTN